MRACYKSKWRLTRGSDRLRSGFYYFSPEGTPFYPGSHNLGSRNWTSDEREPPPLLGEYDGSKSIYSGEPPAKRTLPVSVGDPDCIANGERPGLPIISPVSARCARILPPPCYGVRTELEDSLDVLDCTFAKKCADIIKLAYEDLGDAEAAVAAFLSPDAEIRSFPEIPDLFPATVIAKIADTVVVWQNGTTNNEQLAVQSLYFLTGPINQGPYSASRLYEQAALLLADKINECGWGDIPHLILTGHSYGGAVVQVLAAKMIAADPDREVDLLTLAAPQPGDARLQALIAPLRQTHYINEGDPIPFLPPNGVTIGALWPFLGPILRFIWPEFVGPRHRLVLRADGTMSEVQIDDIDNTLSYSLGLLIAQVRAVPRFTKHKVEQYAFQICRACSCVPRPCDDPLTPAIGMTVAIVNLRFSNSAGDFTESFEEGPLLYAPDIGLGHEQFGGLLTYPDPELLVDLYRDDALNITHALFTYSGNDGFGETWVAQWTFTADELMGGIDDNPAPSFFSGSFPYDSVFVGLDAIRVVLTI